MGKTQLLRRFGKKEFRHDSTSTMNMEFSTRDIHFERCMIRAQIWDTAGQERFESMTKAYYRDAMGAFLVYDVTNRDSFEHLKETWIKQLKDYAHDKIQLMLVGNKVDGNLDSSKRKVSTEEGQALAKEMDIDFTETSAFDGDVEPLFRRCILSVAPIIPDVAVPLELTGLPSGWIIATQAMISQASSVTGPDGKLQPKGKGKRGGYATVTADEDVMDEDDDDDDDKEDVKYCNYWSGDVTSVKPADKAESAMLHEGSPRSIVSSASFCARTVSTDENARDGGFRLQSVKIVDVELEEGDDDDQMTQIERLKSKCACVIV